MSSFPLYFRMFLPKKSNPSSMCVMIVFSSESCRPPLSHKGPYNGQDLVFKEFFRFTSDNEVVGVADKIHLVKLCLSIYFLAGRQFLFQKSFQAVQSHVHQGGRNCSALRRSLLSGEETLCVYKSAFQPLLQNLYIHRNIFQQPVMTDVVKTSLDISFQNPFGGFLFVQIGEALLDCIVRASANSEPVGIPITIGSLQEAPGQTYRASAWLGRSLSECSVAEFSSHLSWEYKRDGAVSAGILCVSDFGLPSTLPLASATVHGQRQLYFCHDCLLPVLTAKALA